MKRRSCLSRLATLAAAPAWALARTDARAQPAAKGAARAGDGPLRLGVEDALALSGLAARWQAAARKDLGLALDLRPGPGQDLLRLLEAGELDAAITSVPQQEAALERQGLIHDRRAVAASRALLVGPPKDPAGIKGLAAAAEALVKIAQEGALSQWAVQTGQPGATGYVAHGEASGLQALEARLWQPLGARAQGPWRRTAPPGPAETLRLAGQWPVGGAYTLVEQAVWARAGKLPLKVWIDADPQLATVYSVARSFRVNHPAGKLLVAWLAGPMGRRVVAAAGGGWRLPPG